MDIANLDEIDMSRRYLRMILRWIPRGAEWFNDWPDRPNCGHFLGGVHWYGQETAMPVLALATAGASPDYDAELTGLSRDEVRSMALKGLRYLCVTNDPFFAEPGEKKAALTLHWPENTRRVEGYAAGCDSEDIRFDLTGSPWLNVDGRFGIVFRGAGRTEYHNRHYYHRWRAVKDDLKLSILDGPRQFECGQTVSKLTTLWVPQQQPGDTAVERLEELNSENGLFAAEVDSYLCACNFSNEPTDIWTDTPISTGTELTAGWGIAPNDESSRVRLRLGGREPLIINK